VSILQLENTLKNVIRTNCTDVEIWNSDHTKQYHQHSDFSVVSPKTKNNAIICNLTALQPYVVKVSVSTVLPSWPDKMLQPYVV
jgi:hypothetical protein